MLTRRSGGATLIEVIIGITIMLGLVMAAVPGFGSWLRDVRIRSTAESIRYALLLARGEAVRLNRAVEFRLVASTGHVAWQVGCPGDVGCAATLQSGDATENGAVSLRVVDSLDTTAFTTVLPTSALLAATPSSPATTSSVQFNGMGRIASASQAGVIHRIDVDGSGGAAGRRLIVLVGQGGQIVACDPAAPATSPRGCVSGS